MTDLYNALIRRQELIREAQDKVLRDWTKLEDPYENCKNSLKK
jgi:hypothetical protein